MHAYHWRFIRPLWPSACYASLPCCTGGRFLPYGARTHNLVSLYWPSALRGLRRNICNGERLCRRRQPPRKTCARFRIDWSKLRSRLSIRACYRRRFRGVWHTHTLLCGGYHLPDQCYLWPDFFTRNLREIEKTGIRHSPIKPYWID